MNLEKNAPYLAMALIAITLIFSQIGIFDEKYNLDLNLLIQESENDAFLELNEYSLSKTHDYSYLSEIHQRAINQRI